VCTYGSRKLDLYVPDFVDEFLPWYTEEVVISVTMKDENYYEILNLNYNKKVAWKNKW
jgi:hypothetical protein